MRIMLRVGAVRWIARTPRNYNGTFDEGKFDGRYDVRVGNHYDDGGGVPHQLTLAVPAGRTPYQAGYRDGWLAEQMAQTGRDGAPHAA